MRSPDIRLGLRENAGQFSLLVAVNGFVGAMVGLERSTLPLIGEQDFGLAGSDGVGRKPLIVGGMLLQAIALVLLAVSGGSVAIAAVCAVVLGAGTALVYPTLIAAISDAVTPVARAATVGVHRFWRDMGYVAGGLIAGLVSDALGFGGAIAIVAGLTAASGLWTAFDMPTQRPRRTGRPLHTPAPSSRGARRGRSPETTLA